ncbi:hypothetical protein CQA49_00575 [Helicobacter sp. MIT 00-7814]|uniref:hypothetical protein n=1 Tax=unclassified Helicobacter TaxID=2593540 RepID=UPI000E1ED3C8|nr:MULTISPECIES: hypothetical protein [unclassified Helicobacter]RDU57192.1 hypothetical protein CQA49_00575 [Helicobacter sp. MIT 00-7814]RDU57744.1 hypothetical protein CQA37_00575 [Helicobacter sp. MIT 99-10781]
MLLRIVFGFCLFCAYAQIAGANALDSQNNAESSSLSNTAHTNLESQNAPQIPFAKISKFVLQNDNFYLKPNTQGFVEILGAELYEKTHFAFFVAVIADSKKECENLLNKVRVNNATLELTLPNCLQKITDSKQNLKSFEKLYTLSNLNVQNGINEGINEELDNAPLYATIFIYPNEKKIDIDLSQNAQGVFDTERVYFEYMVPLLPKPNEELQSDRLSAVVLNGYSEAADLIAAHFNTSLANNIPRDESGGKGFVKFSMYFMLFCIFGVLGFVFLSSKFKKK